MCLMSAFGFACLVFSGTLFSHQGILMIAYSLVALCLSLNRYLRSFRPAKVLSGRAAVWCSARLNKKVVVSLPALVVICFVAANFTALKLSNSKAFSLSELGYYGFGLERDLSFFSKTVRQSSSPRDRVWIYSGQISPAFPLLTQLRRKPGYLVWGFPLHTLKILHERGTPDQIAQLAHFEATMYDRLRVEALSPQPPTLVLVEDGEVHDLFKGFALSLSSLYSPLDGRSTEWGRD
jgi:hypothetical protein